MQDNATGSLSSVDDQELAYNIHVIERNIKANNAISYDLGY